MSTFSGFNCARDGVLISPALLNNRSDGELLAWIARYFRQANRAMAACHECDESYAIHGSTLTHQTFLSRFFRFFVFFRFFRFLDFGKTEKLVFQKNRYFLVYRKTAPA